MDCVRRRKVWLIRVNNGVNFRNSRYPFWGVKRGAGGSIKTVVNKLQPGDILCFITSKPHGGQVIGMAEYTGYYDREDEPLIQVHTKTNEEQNWVGDEKWDIQIHYRNMYVTERQNITACVQCAGVILDYDTFKDSVSRDVYTDYDNFRFYAEPKIFADNV
jgi:hypothetical protein